ncbi:MAG: bifunctional hydroxymethylpyrimidine kinase/phosphomethylpyrimidine kinase [Thermodesulfobacteriota bacterium]
MKHVLTIAGSDPSGGAGIQADLATFSAFGVKGLSAITAVTVQDGGSVNGLFPIPPSFVLQQIEALAEAGTIDAIKIGMLAKGEIVTAIAGVLKRLDIANVVLDPVITSSSGFPLLEKSGLPALRSLLSGLLIVTPNLLEASLLTGRKVVTEDDMGEAAIRIGEMGPRYVLIKGGHLSGDAVDLLYDGDVVTQYVSARIGRELHGTGCILSAALAACLAEGEEMGRAVARSKNYVSDCLRGTDSSGA